MKRRKKILLSICIIILFLLTSLGGLVLYVYTHPSAIKPMIEKSVSDVTGTSVTIETIAYSLKPLTIHVTGIFLKSGDDEQGFRLTVPDLHADMTLTGPFGYKTLVLSHLRLDKFSLHVSEDSRLPEIQPGKKGGTFFSGLLKRAIGLFLFRDIQFQEVTLDGGDVTARGKHQLLRLIDTSAKRRSDGLLELSCGLQVKWLSNDTLFSVPMLRFTTVQPLSFVVPEIRGTLTVSGAAFHSATSDIQGLDGKARLVYDHASKTLSFDPMDLSFESVALKQAGREERLSLKMDLKTTGRLFFADRRIEVDQIHVSLNDAFQLRGEMSAGFGDQTRVDFEIHESRFLPQKLRFLIPGPLKEELSSIAFDGGVGLKGHLQGLKATNRWEWRCDLDGAFDKNSFVYSAEGFRLSSSLTGNIHAEGLFPDIDVSGGIRGEGTEFVGMGWTLKPFSLNIALSGKTPVYEIKDLQARIPEARAVIMKKEVKMDDIRLQILNGRLDSKNRAFEFPDIRLNSSLLKNLHLSLDHDGKMTMMVVEGKEIHLIESASALNLIPRGWQMSGLDNLWLKAILRSGNDLSFEMKVGFRDLRFQDQSSRYMGEKISLETEMNGTINRRDSQINAKTSLEGGGGEILLDRFYFDLNKNPFFTAFEGGYELSKESLRLPSLKLGFKNMISLDLNGSVFRKNQETLAELSIKMPKTPLKPVFHHFLSEPFKAEKPILTTLDVAGNFSLDLMLKGGRSDWMVSGHTLWTGGGLLTEDHGFSVSGIDLDLPLWYQTRKAEPEAAPLKGRLYIESLTVPLLPKQSLKIPLNALPNQLSVPIPTILMVPGGEVQLGPITCQDLFTTRSSMDTSLTFKAIELGPILSPIWSRPIEGSIRGTLRPLQLNGKTLKSRGQITARAFGGEIVLSDVGGSDLFSSAPLFKTNVLFKDLQLGALTTDTSFGKIEGVLEGYINDLTVAHGQPQEFDLLLETVKRERVPQRISVRAVDSIARIGGGQSPFMGLAGALTSFFREFPYEKIGVHASLENDVFRINGTIKEDDKEYLVKRGGFSGVNVVNQNPDNRISFKDMVKRIGRITASKGGAVIK